MINSLKDAAKVIRAELKDLGIKARVSCRNSCGSDFVNIDPVAHDIYFTEDEQFDIAIFVKSFGFTWVREMEIIVDQYTNGPGFHHLERSAS